MYQVEIINKGGSGFVAKTNASELSVDTKPDSITPLDLLLAGLGSCLGVFLRRYAEGVKLDLPAFSVRVEAELSKDPLCFKEMSVTVDFKGKEFDDQRKKAILEFIKSCPVHNTLKNSPQINIRIL